MDPGPFPTPAAPSLPRSATTHERSAACSVTSLAKADRQLGASGSGSTRARRSSIAPSVSDASPRSMGWSVSVLLARGAIRCRLVCQTSQRASQWFRRTWIWIGSRWARALGSEHVVPGLRSVEDGYPGRSMKAVAGAAGNLHLPPATRPTTRPTPCAAMRLPGIRSPALRSGYSAIQPISYSATPATSGSFPLHVATSVPLVQSGACAGRLASWTRLREKRQCGVAAGGYRSGSER